MESDICHPNIKKSILAGSPPALISVFEASWDSLSIISPVTGCNSGSVSTSLTILESIWASKSLSCLINRGVNRNYSNVIIVIVAHKGGRNC